MRKTVVVVMAQTWGGDCMFMAFHNQSRPVITPKKVAIAATNFPSIAMKTVCYVSSDKKIGRA